MGGMTGIYSFNSLIEKYGIEIPVIQRDYAYGRKEAEVTEKRNNFLSNLKGYFIEKHPHVLDYTYGSLKDNRIVFLDGQQRVTTLFLLHWYLSLIKDKNGNNNFTVFSANIRYQNGDSKFSYKTRDSALDFCNRLVDLKYGGKSYIDEYVSAIENIGVVLSEKIQNEKWFLPHWCYDPTIMSMLTMLDSIKEHFPASECQEYYSKLVDEEWLKFRFLDLEEFGLTDDLYVKMNSRGKPLTRFENIKSKLLKLYDGIEIEDPTEKKDFFDKQKDKMVWIKNKYKLGESYKSLRDCVSFLLDTKWTDVFWNQWKDDPNHTEIPNVDEKMLAFIANMAIYNHILFVMEQNDIDTQSKEARSKDIKKLLNKRDKDKGITITYDVFVQLFCENKRGFLFDLIDYFTAIYDKGNWKKHLQSNVWYSDEEFIKSATDYSNSKNFEDKTKAFAYIKYLKNNEEPDATLLEKWMHFVWKVCANSYTLNNSELTFCNAIVGFDHLCPDSKKPDISDMNCNAMQYDTANIATLDKTQIEEERLKNALSANPKWKQSIEDAEKNLPYFEGRLSYPLIECCDVSKKDVNDQAKLTLFNKYVEILKAIFPKKDGCDVECELIRAMLSKGNYLLKSRSNNSLLKNEDRDISWKRFLKEKQSDEPDSVPHADGDKRLFFKQVIDDLNFDVNDVKGSLEKIADAKAVGIPNWRRVLIECKDILNNTEITAFGTDRYIRWNAENYNFRKDTEDNYEIDLIPRSAITGFHSELFSLGKYYELKGKQFKSYGMVQYMQEKTAVKQPYFYLKKGNDEIRVLYQGDNSFKFVDATDNVIKSSVPYDNVEDELQSIVT